MSPIIFNQEHKPRGPEDGRLRQLVVLAGTHVVSTSSSSSSFSPFLRLMSPSIFNQEHKPRCPEDGRLRQLLELVETQVVHPLPPFSSSSSSFFFRLLLSLMLFNPGTQTPLPRRQAPATAGGVGWD